jgi:hypothetical protein
MRRRTAKDTDVKDFSVDSKVTLKDQKELYREGSLVQKGSLVQTTLDYYEQRTKHESLK